MKRSTIALAISLLFAPAAAQAFDAAAVQRLRSGDTNMRDADLTGANLDDVRLRGTDFTGANLTGATLRNAQLQGARFVRSNLTNLIATGIQLENVTFREANLTAADFSGAAMQSVVIDRSTLRRTRFAGARMDRVAFQFGDLEDVDLSRTNQHFTVYGSSEPDARITLTRVNFSHSTITSSVFYRATLRNADVSNVTTRDMIGTNLTVIDSDLRSMTAPEFRFGTARFESTNLTGADFTASQFATDSQFINNRCDPTTRWPSNSPIGWRTQCTQQLPQPGTTSISTPAVTPSQPPETTSTTDGGTTPPLNATTTIALVNTSGLAVQLLGPRVREQLRPLAHGCYINALGTAPTLQGQITGELRIERGGVVSEYSVAPATSTLTNAGLLSCVRDAFRSARFTGVNLAVRMNVRVTLSRP